MIKCHKETEWDSITTHNALIGEWKWEFVMCFSDSEGGNYDDYKGLSIQFKSNNKLDLKIDGQIVQTSDWKIVVSDPVFFSLSVNPPVLQLNGRVLFCDNRLEFNYSFLDQCDNFFLREM